MYRDSDNLSVGWILITQEDMPPPQAGPIAQEPPFATCCHVSRPAVILERPASPPFYKQFKSLHRATDNSRGIM